jgi:hypothetical protein
MTPGRSVRVLSAAALAVTPLLVASVTAQSRPAPPAQPTANRPAATAPRSTTPSRRTPDGRPDLQGTWDFAQLTPFERPGQFGEKSVLSDDEAEAFGQSRTELENKDRRDGSASDDVARAYNDFWWDFGTRVAKQTSLVVEPPTGRLPALTPAAQQKAANRTPKYDNVEERPLAERCILGFNSGPPMMPSAYNNNMQLVQTPGHIVILNEMVHSARIIDMSGRPHRPASVRFLTGDSIGRWDGDTLVVDTTNFSIEGNFRFSTRDMHLVERFSLENDNTLRYEFTMDDPAVWSSKWTASIPMTRTDNLIFEYACHEANYGLEGVLRGARFADKQPPADR